MSGLRVLSDFVVLWAASQVGKFFLVCYYDGLSLVIQVCTDIVAEGLMTVFSEISREL
jgi:hypothetical protein